MLLSPSGFQCVSHQGRMNSLLLMMGAVKKCQVERKRSLENLSQRGISLAVTLWVTLLYFLSFSSLYFLWDPVLEWVFSDLNRVCVCVIFTPAHLQSFSAGAAIQLSFHKNGRFMGVAFSLGASVLQGVPLFPHVLCKSCSVRFLLDPTTPPWYPGPPGFTPLAALPAGQRVRSTFAPSSRAQCEVRDGLSSWVSIQSIFLQINLKF